MSLYDLLIGKPSLVADPFEKLQADLWGHPLIASGSCAWCNLTDQEKVQWGAVLWAQGEAEKAGDIAEWKRHAEKLLEIALKVQERQQVYEKVGSQGNLFKKGGEDVEGNG